MKPLRALGFVLSGEPGRDGAWLAIHWLTGLELWSHALDLSSPSLSLLAFWWAPSMPPVVSVWSLMSSDCRGASFHILMISIFAYCRNSPPKEYLSLVIHPHFHPSQSSPTRTLTLASRTLLVLPTLCHVRRLFVALAEFRSKARQWLKKFEIYEQAVDSFVGISHRTSVYPILIQEENEVRSTNQTTNQTPTEPIL